MAWPVEVTLLLLVSSVLPSLMSKLSVLSTDGAGQACRASTLTMWHMHRLLTFAETAVDTS